MHIQSDLTQATSLNIYKQQSERVRPEKAQGAGGRTGGADSGGDTVNVSDNARMLAEINRAAQDSSDIRQDKVALLKAQVDNGAYQMDNTRIATALLREDMDIFR